MIAPVKKILVYVDGSEHSVTAAQYAIVLANILAAELHALYVIDTRALSDLVKSRIFLDAEREEYKHDLEEDASRYLNHVKNLGAKKGITIFTSVSSGAINVEIKNKVSEEHIDLLIIGELPKIRSRRDELYNEPSRAMRNLHCSVLIAKGEDAIWEMYEKMDFNMYSMKRYT
jgi:nucleotide-binding universal stress UspA family protein